MRTANVNMGSDSDDVWADDGSDGSDDGRPDAGHSELHREASSRHQRFYNAGYRDGLDEGKEQTLQEGFNIGFKDGAAAGFEWGLLRGALRTLGALDGQVAGIRSLHTQIQALQAASEVAPRTAMLGILHQILSQPISPSWSPPAAAATTIAVPRFPPDTAGAPDRSVDPHDPATTASTCAASQSVEGADDRNHLPAAFSAMLTVCGSQTAVDKYAESASGVVSTSRDKMEGSALAAVAMEGGGDGAAPPVAAGQSAGGGSVTASEVTSGVAPSGYEHAVGAQGQQLGTVIGERAGRGPAEVTGGEGTAEGPSATLLLPAGSQPPGAPGGLDLPDMRQLMAGLRRELKALGFQLGQAPSCGAMGRDGSSS